MTELSCKQIADMIDGVIVGNPDAKIYKLNRIETAAKGELTFLAREEYEKYLDTTQATAIIVPSNFDKLPKDGLTFIKCEKPYEAFIKLLKDNAFKPKRKSGVHPSAFVDQTASIHPEAYIGPYCVVGAGSVVGKCSELIAHVTLYDNVKIGENCTINAGVVCYHEIEIGNDCIIHSNAVIGADGFGFLEDKNTGSWDKIPQIGNVVIGNRVEIGANTTIDRALLGSTIIEDGVILDNLIQIAHNCVIGENTAIASQAGVSGSTKIGKRNKIGGQVGFAGHLETCDDITIIAQSGVSKSVTQKGIYFGSPIKDRLTAFKIEACMRQLPDLINEFNDIKKKIIEK